MGGFGAPCAGALLEASLLSRAIATRDGVRGGAVALPRASPRRTAPFHPRPTAMFARMFTRSTRFAHAQRRTVFNFETPLSRENVPVYGALVGIAAMSFQIGVLYPWHKELSEQFRDIENLITRLNATTVDLDVKLERVMAMERSVKAKERQILSHGEDIMKMEHAVLRRIDEITETLHADNAKLEAEIVKLESEVVVETLTREL